MSSQHCRIIVILLALIASGAVILTPTTLASLGASQDIQVTGITDGTAVGATQLPVLWTAGGISAGSDGAGPAARMAVDGLGNIAIVSGPAGGSLLAVTSYTSDGQLRWRSTIAPISGR